MFTRDAFRDVIHCRGSRAYPGWYDYFARETVDRYGDAVAGLRQAYPDDFLRFEPDDLEHWSPVDAPATPGTELAADLWGCVWRSSPGSVGKTFERPALAGWDGLDDYLKRLPDPRRPGRFDGVCRAAARPDGRYRLGVFWLSLFERLHLVRAIDDLFCDFYERPEQVTRLLDAVQAYLEVTIDCFAESGMDGILLGEDWGMQDRLMVSPAMWRAWFRPRYESLFGRIHDHGMDVWVHSCGKIDAIIGDLIDVGLDVLHPLQYGCVDWEWFASTYGGSVCVLGCVDVCQVLTQGTPEDVSRHVRRVVEVFGREGGGLILAPGNTIMPETPLANMRALFETMDSYRT